MMPAQTSQPRRALELAIEQAFFMSGSAAAVARNFSSFGHVLHASDVRRIWANAREAGRLPNVRRPPGGAKNEGDAVKYANAYRRKLVKSQTTHHRVDTTLRRADKEMSKAEMRRELAEAVRNTAAMPVEGEGKRR